MSGCGPGTVLGFDYGARRIGVAVAAALSDAARPLAVVRARIDGPDWESIGALIRQWQPDLLVVGLPRHADDSPHRLQGAVHAFARELAERFALPVETVDEGLSSVAARERRPRRAAVGLDAVAAQVILETWLSERSATARRMEAGRGG